MADVAQPHHHQSGAIRFDYPSNWEISDDQFFGEGVQYLSVESPGDSIVLFQTNPLVNALGLEAYAQPMGANTGDASPGIQFVSQGFGPLTETNGMQQITERFDVKLLGETISHTRVIYKKDFPTRRIFVTCQAPTEDLQRVQLGFDLILRTLDEIVPSVK